MSVHFAGACHVVDRVVCQAEDETKRNTRQPRIVQQGFTKKITIRDGVATIH